MPGETLSCTNRVLRLRYKEQDQGREFESHHPLQFSKNALPIGGAFVFPGIEITILVGDKVRLS